MIRAFQPHRHDRMHRCSRVTAGPSPRLPDVRSRARRWAPAILLALAAAAGSAGAQDPNSAQGRQQAHTAEMNRLGHMQQEAAMAPTPEEIAAQQAAYEAVGRRDAAVRNDQQRDWWGVLVVNVEEGYWNATYDAMSPEEALQQALLDCDGDCRMAVAFANTCLAPAQSAQGALFFAAGDDKEEAVDAATRKCTAAGGSNCSGQEDKAVCTGYRYAYSRMERLNERLNFVAIGRNARPKVEFSQGLEAYLAKPLDARGAPPPADPALSAAARPGGPSSASADQPWTAIAVPRGGGKGVGLHLGTSRQNAIDTAMQKCGEPNCEVLLTFTHGQCGAAVIAPAPGGARTFGAVGESGQVAAQEATAACTGSGGSSCQPVFNQCM
ncbi:DUF4189 domain-containing protein [Luteimonas sp. Y-2-2-4F]|nr:DUF4189 domain-containing protein [Luteimonas sp. Y-2-2-4F]MCD9032067.1 DUF4189 domain-containing protein [Luteimonas sp. Y-2-2-4F]